MAKSLRSKWKRKMKAVKRERYGKKELERLKVILEKAKENDANVIEDVTMTDNSELYTVVKKPDRKSRKSQHEEDESEDGEVESMDTGDKKIKIYNQETMRDQFGNYPVWMSSHRRKRSMKIAKKNHRQKIKTIKKKKQVKQK